MGGRLYTWCLTLFERKDIEEARKSSTKKLFAQEYECEWTTTELQVYDLNEETLVD